MHDGPSPPPTSDRPGPVTDDLTRVVDPAAPAPPASILVGSTDAELLFVAPAGNDGFPGLGQTVEGFLLVAELGRGAFGRAYLGRQQSLAGRFVVLKFSPVEFVTEAHTLARLQHTNIVPLFSVHAVGPLVALCMPYFPGPTLAAVLHELKKETQLPDSGRWLVGRLGLAEEVAGRQQLAQGTYVEACLRLAAGLADGLAHAHERGIVHRDIKPANVLLTAEGVPMLLDFNLARDAGRDRADLAGGTLPYMAPETLEALAENRLEADPRQDVFALGVVLYELLTGQFPFPPRPGATAAVLRELIADRKAPTADPREGNPALTPAVAAIVRRCLAADPARRYPSARALHDDLTRHLENRPLLHTPEPSWQERLGKWSRRHPRVSVGASVLAVALAVLGALGGLLWSVWSHGSDLEARQALAHLEDELKRLPAMLAAGDDPAAQEIGLRRCEELAAGWGLPDADWLKRPPASRLDTAARERLRVRAGILLWLWGQALARTPAPVDRLRLLNDRARECFDRPPGAVLRQQAELMRRDGDADGADRLLASADGTSPLGPLLDLMEHAERGEWAQAMPLLQEALAGDSSNPGLWLLLSRVSARMGRLSEARTFAELATSLSPRWAWAWGQRGLLALADRDPRAALAAFDRAVECGGGTEARLNRALTLHRLGMLNEALAELDGLLRDDATPARAWFIREKVRFQAGDLAGAQDDHERGLRATPADLASWLARAAARVKGDPRGALADLDEALKVAPRSAAVWRNRAHLLSEHFRQPEEAIKALTEALRVSPGDVQALAGRAVLLARDGQFARALADCRAVEENRGADGGSLYRCACARALVAAKRPAERDAALRMLRRALLKDPAWAEVAPADDDLKALHGRKEFLDLLREAGEWARGVERL
jgi:serine/threonine protein kinase/tetratricopeptide (TPR) repeat protein